MEKIIFRCESTEVRDCQPYLERKDDFLDAMQTLADVYELFLGDGDQNRGHRACFYMMSRYLSCKDQYKIFSAELLQHRDTEVKMRSISEDVINAIKILRTKLH